MTHPCSPDCIDPSHDDEYDEIEMEALRESHEAVWRDVPVTRAWCKDTTCTFAHWEGPHSWESDILDVERLAQHFPFTRNGTTYCDCGWSVTPPVGKREWWSHVVAEQRRADDIQCRRLSCR